MNDKPIKVKSIDDLKEKCKTAHDFFIWLGGARSSKNIYHENNKFEIYNEIDDTFDDLTDSQLMDKSNIGKAIKEGMFYQY